MNTKTKKLLAQQQEAPDNKPAEILQSPSSKTNAFRRHRNTMTPLGYDPRGFININMLAESKKHTCVLCEGTGTVVCESCMVTYYCTVDHFLLDKDFHAGVCSKVKSLMQPIEFSPLRETRERWAKQRRIHMEELFLYAWKRSQADLDKGNYEAAIPAATVATKYAKILYGQTEEMIEPMLVAAECHLNKGSLILAEGFIARALNIEVNKLDLRPYIKSRIRHMEGIIAMAKDEPQEALVNFADEAYQASEEYGPIHRKTSEGYCNMGRVYHQSGEFATSSSLFRRVVDIWIKFAEPVLEEMTDETAVPTVTGMKPRDKVWVEDSDEFKGEDLLTHCYTNQRECQAMVPANYHVTVVDLARTCYALSILFFICKRMHEAGKKASEALKHLEEKEEKEANAPLWARKLQRLVNLTPLVKKLQRVLKLSARMSNGESHDADIGSSDMGPISRCASDRRSN